MSSLFRARRSDEARSGGKMLRGRRPTPSASPYARPAPAPAPEPQESGSPRWLAGLISGAGKLISSVLPSYRSSASPSSSSGCSSGDEDISSDADEERLQPLNQRENSVELVNRCVDGQLAIVPKSETKLAIEQLLMQETFSRDECDKLTKLIQSRVVDFPSPEVFEDGTGKFQRTTGSDALPGALSSFTQKRTLWERIHYLSSRRNDFSPGSSLFEACTPDICNKAVSEAKKWLDEKKLEAKQKYDPECGPCTLNTDTLQYDIEGDGGSPADMAKSYMRSLPPWRSPSFSGVNTPLPCGVHRYRDETLFETAKDTLTSSKGLKRERLLLGAWDTLDESSQVRVKSARVSEHESSKTLSPADKRGLHLHSHNPFSGGAFALSNKKDTDPEHQSERGNLDSSNFVSEPEEIIGLVHSSHEISVPNTHTLEPTKTLDETQDHTREPLRNMEKVDKNIVAPHDSLALTSGLAEEDGNPLSQMPTENAKSAMQRDANCNDIQTSEVQTGTEIERAILSDGCSSQLNTISGTAEATCSSDSRPQDGNSDVPEKANGPINESNPNGSSAAANEKFNSETLSKETDATVSRNGTGVESNERMPTEPRRTPSRRAKRVAVKPRRGRKT